MTAESVKFLEHSKQLSKESCLHPTVSERLDTEQWQWLTSQEISHITHIFLRPLKCIQTCDAFYFGWEDDWPCWTSSSVACQNDQYMKSCIKLTAKLWYTKTNLVEFASMGAFQTLTMESVGVFTSPHLYNSRRRPVTYSEHLSS